MPETTPSILDLPPRYQDIHRNVPNEGAVIRAAAGKLGEKLKSAIERHTHSEIQGLERKVKDVIEQAINGTVAEHIGLTYNKHHFSGGGIGWRLDPTYTWKADGKTIRELVAEHTRIMIDQLKEAVQGRKMSDEELARAEELYHSKFNDYLPEAIERQAKLAADEAAAQLFAARREVLLKAVLDGDTLPEAEAK